MIVWATEFPLCQGVKCDDLCRLSQEWIVGSPHSSWRMEMCKEGPQNEVVHYKHNGQSVFIARAKLANKEWFGLRYNYFENNERSWMTEIVGFDNSDCLCVSVRVFCDLLQPGLNMPHPRKPHIIRQLIQSYGGGLDGNLPITDKPKFLEEQDVDKAISMIKGETGNQLPVIYASANWKHAVDIDVAKLAQWTSGLAHVVVEPSRYFSFALGDHVSRTNPYGGAIGIYWPNRSARQTRFLIENFDNPQELASEMADCVRRAMINMRPSADCSWGSIQEQISKNKIQDLKDSGSIEINDYIEEFDNEISAKQKRLDEAEHEISRLKIELQKTAAIADANEGGVITIGNEKPFYLGELRDCIIKALKAGRGQMQQGGRSRHIIDDLLVANKPSCDGESIEKEIKDIICKECDLSRTTRRSLERIGFSFEEDGKHIRMVYRNDPRYAFTVQKTGSDWRGMKNLSAEIIRKLFK
ncbi:MAG: hypothetical protein K4571_19235 [Deltaproteobacteria bacterium]